MSSVRAVRLAEPSEKAEATVVTAIAVTGFPALLCALTASFKPTLRSASVQEVPTVTEKASLHWALILSCVVGASDAQWGAYIPCSAELWATVAPSHTRGLEEVLY